MFCKVSLLALSVSWTVKVTDTAELPHPWRGSKASPHLSTASSQKLEGTVCVLTGNLLPDSAGDVLLGPAVLRTAFGTCERERRPLSPPIFPELREFLREFKAVLCHKWLFIFCQRNCIMCLFWRFLHHKSKGQSLKPATLHCHGQASDHPLLHKCTGCKLRLL